MGLWKRHSVFKAALLCGTAVALAAHADPAAAQEGGQATVGEIIVTAQRRAEPLENVPMSVAAVSAETIQNSGVTSIHDLDQLAAGVKMEFAGCCSQPSIRGVSTLTTGSGFESNVAIYIDGFYTPDNISINMDLGSNISDVQILKGPQGALYGRNATGGAILINTAAPSKTFTANVSGSYARFNEYTLGAYVSGPISDGARYSFAAYRRDSDGYVKYIDPAGTGRRFGNAAPIRQESIRGKVEVDLTSNLTGTFGLNYGLSADPRGNIFTVYQYSPATRPRAPFSASEPYTASPSFQTSVQAIVKEGTAKFEWRNPLGVLTSYTGFAHRNLKYDYDFDGSYARIQEAGSYITQDTFQQTLDYVINTVDKLDLVVGGNYYRDAFHVNGSISIAANGVVANRLYETIITEAWAGYIDGTYHLTDRLALNVGGRYSTEKKSIDYRQVNGALTANVVPPASADARFSRFTPRATIRFEVAPRTNIYASWSKGFRSGGFQTQPVSNPALLLPFRPEKITAYEVGFKTARQIYRFEAAAYYYDYRDLQVGVTIPNPIGVGLINQVSNAPKAELYGLDLQASVTPTRGLTVRAGLAFIHGRYKEFPGATNVGWNPATGLNVSQVGDWSGLQMARAPEVSGNLSADYETELAGGRLLLSGSVSYTSDYPVSNPSVLGPLAVGRERIQRFKNKEFTLVNAQVSWTDPSEHYTFGVFGSNLLNEKYLMTSNGSSLWGDYRMFGQPRSYGVRASYKY